MQVGFAPLRINAARPAFWRAWLAWELAVRCAGPLGSGVAEFFVPAVQLPLPCPLDMQWARSNPCSLSEPSALLLPSLPIPQPALLLCHLRLCVLHCWVWAWGKQGAGATSRPPLQRPARGSSCAHRPSPFAQPPTHSSCESFRVNIELELNGTRIDITGTQAAGREFDCRDGGWCTALAASGCCLAGRVVGAALGVDRPRICSGFCQAAGRLLPARFPP